jgi:hypothetical protein
LAKDVPSSECPESVYLSDKCDPDFGSAVLQQKLSGKSKFGWGPLPDCFMGTTTIKVVAVDCQSFTLTKERLRF